MRAIEQIGRRGRAVIILAVAVLGLSAAAWAYWSAPSSGHASGAVGTLGGPSIEGATPGAGTVTLKWSAVTAPGGGSVAYYVSRDGGAASGACPSSATPAAQLGCTDTGVPIGEHSYVVTAVWRSWTAHGESASAQVTSGVATHFALTPATTTPNAGAADNLTIVAQDASNNTVTSYSGTKSLTFGGASSAGSFHPTVTSDAASATSFGTAEPIDFTGGVATVSGSANGAMRLYKAETAKITVTDGTLSNGGGASVTVSAATAVSFSLPTPATQTAGKAFNETLTALDEYGNVATAYSGSKLVSFSGPASSPGGKAPVYPATVSFSSGEGTAAITIYNAAATTLSAQEASISGSSASFAVSAASAASLSLAAASTTPLAGEADNLTITALDAYGNTATSYPTSKSLTFGGASTIGSSKPTVSNSSGTAVGFGSSTTIAFSGGVAKVSGSSNGAMRLYKAETAKVTVSDGTLGNGAGLAVTVGAASASTFTLATPSTQTAGSAFEVKIAAKDAFGNTASGYAGSKTIAFSGPGTSPGGKAPSYPASVGFSSGEASATIAIYDAGATTLSAQEGSVSGGTGSFTVNPASAASLSLTALDTTPGAGEADDLAIAALDAYGNTATSYTGSHNLTFTGAATVATNKPTVVNSSGTTVSFGNSTSISFTSGESSVQFGSRNGVMKLYAAETAKVIVTDGTLSNGSGLTVTVSPGSFAQLSVTTPGTQTAGKEFSLALSAKDAYGNGVSGSQSLSFSGPTSAPDGAAPSYPATVTFAGGEGKAQVTLPKAQTTSITVKQGSVSGSTASFTVNPGAAAELSLSAAGTTAAGASDNLTIFALDTFGNVATSYAGSHNLTFGGPHAVGPNNPTVSNSSGTAVNFGSTTAISFSSGEATVQSGTRNGVMKLYAAESTHVTVTDGSIGNGGGLAVTVEPGSLTVSVATPSTQTAGTAFNLSLTAKDAYGNTANGSLPVTFSGPEGSASEKAPSYPSAVTFTAGSGTASVTLYASGPTTIAAKLSGAEGKTGTFTVSPASATKLAWTTVGGVGEAEGLCLFTCTWTGLGKSHQWSAKVSVTDSYGNVVSNVGSGHTVTWTSGPTLGTVSPSSLTLPSSGAATTSSSVTYTSPGTSGNWSDAFSAHSSGYADATVALKK